MDLDVSYLLPAILFTLFAIIVGSSFFTKKQKPTNQTPPDVPHRHKEPEKPSGGYAERKVPEPAPIVVHKEEPKAEEVVAEEKVEEKGPEVVAVAPVVEEMGVVEEQPATEPDVPPAPETTGIQEPEPELEKEPEAVPEEEPIPDLIPGSVVEEVTPEDLIEPESVPEPTPAPEHVLEKESVAEHNEGDVKEDGSLKYTPGRTPQFEEMMTNREMEEEQRVELTTDFTSL
ncbi:hypothetical protein AAFF_G00123750 [Aldrovandia affinis]|uniref:Matrix-remodeling-associated protein 7 n=1 Tax=Aldrovandia affinis TaxID=143900 RepID=A0AAD7RRR9_9TELE|nr:hypothetical protein AAFF_G00123750 [Aldrovandia affinis]